MMCVSKAARPHSLPPQTPQQSWVLLRYIATEQRLFPTVSKAGWEDSNRLPLCPGTTGMSLLCFFAHFVP